MKKIIIFINLTFFILSIPIITHATTTDMDKIIKGGDSFLKAHEAKTKEEDGTVEGETQQKEVGINQDKLKKVLNDLFNIFYYIGIVASVLVAAILGIKIMFSSAEEKAQVKEALVPYIIGCFVIFGAFGFWRLAVNIFSSLE